MNARNLLDDIIRMLHTVSDDRARLEKLHKFMRDEIYQDPTAAGNALQMALDENPDVPERYKPLLKTVGKDLGKSMICYLNPDTLEVVSIPEDVTLQYVLDDPPKDGDPNAHLFHQDMKRIQHEWKDPIVIEPPQSFESFRFMERFASLAGDRQLRNSLDDALQGHRPFRNFNRVMHGSECLDQWYAFRQKCLELYAARCLRFSSDSENSSGGI